MTANQLVARNLIGVLAATVAFTAVGLQLGRHAPARPYQPVVTNDPPGTPSPARGEALFARFGCNACHTVDGSPRVGPSLAKRWGTSVALADGTHVAFDAAYVRASLRTPQAQAQPGYPPAMPTFDGVMTDRQIADLVAYLSTL